MGKSKVKGNTGKRYTDAQKKQVLDFVASQGRGGIIAAQRKFGVSYIAMRRWMNSSGKTTKASTAYPALKNANLQSQIQREVERQIKPHVAHLVLLKTRIKELVKAI